MLLSTEKVTVTLVSTPQIPETPLLTSLRYKLHSGGSGSERWKLRKSSCQS